jgi:hypothetical protein
VRALVLSILLTAAATSAANEAGWDIEWNSLHFTICYNESFEQYENYAVWRGGGVEYRVMRFPEVSDCAEARLLYEQAINRAIEVESEAALGESYLKLSDFSAGCEVVYILNNGKDKEIVRYLVAPDGAFAVSFKCAATDWGNYDFERKDFFESLSEY